MESPPPAPLASPLTTFLYVLMRDHLPTGTVKWLIERSQAAGEPAYSAPELEQLAKRYADDLLMAPPRAISIDDEDDNGGQPDGQPPAPEPPPADPPASKERVARPSKIGGKVSAATVQKTRDWLRGRGKVKPGDLDEALDFSSATRARVIRALSEEGFIDVQYDGHQRVLVVLGDQKDAGEASKAKAPAAGLQVGGARDPKGPLADQARRNAEAKQKREAAAEAKPPPAPARKGETDIELMARVSDFIQDASDRGEAVWPRELETHFNIDGRRRKAIIEMLTQRQRIIERHANSPQVHYVYKQPGTNPDFRFDHGDDDGEDGLGGGKMHLKENPDLERRVALIAERDETARFIVSKHMDTIREWCKGVGNFTARQLRDVFKVSTPTSHRVCGVLQESGFLEQVGVDGRTGIYAVAGSPNGKGKVDPAHPGKRPLHAGGDGSTLDGRALGAVQSQGGMTITELAANLSVGEEVARVVMGRLLSEGEVRPKRQGATVRYLPV